MVKHDADRPCACRDAGPRHGDSSSAAQRSPFTKLYLKKYTMTVLPLPLVLEVRFHATDQGREPVRDWLKSLSPDARKSIGEDIKTVQFG